MDLSDSLHRTLRQMAELFRLDATSLYLFDQDGHANAAHRGGGAPLGIRPAFSAGNGEAGIDAAHQGGACDISFRAGIAASHGFPRSAAKRRDCCRLHRCPLVEGPRHRRPGSGPAATPREFSPADVNLLIAVGSQISSAIERSMLYEETRQAYENLRRTQEQLLHSEKMAAVGQLISGVAHELNNPLTAILGYSQLLTSSGQMGAQGIEYVRKTLQAGAADAPHRAEPAELCATAQAGARPRARSTRFSKRRWRCETMTCG